MNWDHFRFGLAEGSLLILALFVFFRIWPGISPKVQAWCWRLALLKLCMCLVSVPNIDLPVLKPAPAPPVVLPADLALVAVVPMSSPPPVPETNVWPWLWSAGILICAIHMLRRVWSVRGLLRESEELDEGAALTFLASLCGRARLRSVPELRRSKLIASITLVGGWRYRILLPKPLPTGTEPSDLRLGLAHEIAHIRRRDLWWSTAAWFVRSLFFFNPLCWLAFRELHATQECATDEEAIRLAGSTVPEYGQMLLRAMLSGPSSHRHVPATIGLNDSYRMAYRRLKSMKHFSPRTSLLRKACALAILALALGALPTYSLSAAPTRAKHHPQSYKQRVAARRVRRSKVASRVVVSFPAEGKLSLTYEGPERRLTVAPAATRIRVSPRSVERVYANTIKPPHEHNAVSFVYSGGHKLVIVNPVATTQVRYLGLPAPTTSVLLAAPAPATPALAAPATGGVGGAKEPAMPEPPAPASVMFSSSVANTSPAFALGITSTVTPERVSISTQASSATPALSVSPTEGSRISVVPSIVPSLRGLFEPPPTARLNMQVKVGTVQPSTFATIYGLSSIFGTTHSKGPVYLVVTPDADPRNPSRKPTAMQAERSVYRIYFEGSELKIVLVPNSSGVPEPGSVIYYLSPKAKAEDPTSKGK